MNKAACKKFFDFTGSMHNICKYVTFLCLKGQKIKINNILINGYKKLILDSFHEILSHLMIAPKTSWLVLVVFDWNK